MRFGSALTCLLASLYLIVSIATAQEQENSIPLPDHLRKLEDRHQVSFSFNQTLLVPLTVDQSGQLDDLEAELSRLASLWPVQFEALDSATYLVIPIRQSVSLRIVDGSSLANQ